MALRVLFCFMLLMATGCIHRSQRVRDTVVINQPLETAWPAILKTAQQLDPNAVGDMTTGMISTGDFLTFLTEDFRIEDWARPPRRLFPFWTDTRASATFTGREYKAGQTEVTAQCRFYRFNSNGDVWEPWPSLGELEPFLLTQLQQQDAGGVGHSKPKIKLKPRSTDASLLLQRR